VNYRRSETVLIDHADEDPETGKNKQGKVLINGIKRSGEVRKL